MSILHNRIMDQGQGSAYHPAGTAETPMIMPLAVVRYEAYSDIYYEAVSPIITADGAVVPAAHSGGHAQVVPAG